MKHIYILLSVLTLFSCARTEKQDVQVTQINIDAPNPQNSIEDIVCLDSLKAIKLEVSDASLLARINKVLIYKDRIYVADTDVAKAIMIFDTNGKFISKPTKMGAGPMEHLSISDFQIDKRSDQLLVLDRMRESILCYTLEGEYITVKKTGVRADYFSIMENGNYVFGLEEYASKKMFKDDEHYKVVVTDSEFKILDKFYDVDQGTSAVFSVPQRLAENRGGEILFSPVFRDTIYSLTNKEFSPKYALNYSFGKKMPDGLMKGLDMSTLSRMKRDEDYVSSTGTFFENESHIFLGVQRKDDPMGAYSVYFDKNTKNTKTYQRLIRENSQIYKMLYSGLVGSYGDYFISSFGYIGRMDKENIANYPYPKEFKDVLMNTSRDDNPLLILYKLKEF